MNDPSRPLAGNPYPADGPTWLIIAETGLFLLQLGLLAVVALVRLLSDGGVADALALAQKSSVVALVLVRRPARYIDRSPAAWLAMGFGTYGLFFLGSPAAAIPAWGLRAAVVLELIAYPLMIASLLSLGASFGMLPANRGVVARGLYRFIRHPYYAATIPLFVGAALQCYTARALAVLVLCLLSQWHRMRAEERLLAYDPAYAAYRERVRYRCLYGVY